MTIDKTIFILYLLQIISKLIFCLFYFVRTFYLSIQFFFTYNKEEHCQCKVLFLSHLCTKMATEVSLANEKNDVQTMPKIIFDVNSYIKI